MQIIAETVSLRKQISLWRREGQRIAFVPTMGDIHQGHLALISKAAEHADVVVVSIFTNPQHAEKTEDSDAAARILEQDITLLRESGVALLFTPSTDDICQTHIDQHAYVEVPNISTILVDSDIINPNHLQVVTTTLCKLFNQVQPDVACFGEKDYQRLVIIEKMVKDLCYPIEIVSIPTVREIDGLVISRRNKKLTGDERQRAPVLTKTLRWLSGQMRSGRRDFSELGMDGKDQLRAAGLTPDEIYIRDARTLLPATETTDKVVIMASISLSETRLIDNLVVEITQPAAKQTDTSEEEE